VSGLEEEIVTKIAAAPALQHAWAGLQDRVRSSVRGELEARDRAWRDAKDKHDRERARLDARHPDKGRAFADPRPEVDQASVARAALRKLVGALVLVAFLLSAGCASKAAVPVIREAEALLRHPDPSDPDWASRRDTWRRDAAPFLPTPSPTPAPGAPR